MAFTENELAELKLLCQEVGQLEEGGCTYLLLTGLKLPQSCSPSRIDALLCPAGRDGYTSRLFFAERVQSPSHLNWNANAVRIGERNWNAYSWNVAPGLRLAQMVAAHIKALQ